MKIISGGQTGVDRAALDVALELGLPCGGWCPRGRKAEDGPIPARYPLRETPSVDYRQRTRWNVAEADGTLILVDKLASGPGTRLTLRLAQRSRKPCLEFGPLHVSETGPPLVREWIERQRIATLNVAGPRESTSPGIYEAAASFLRRVLLPFVGL